MRRLLAGGSAALVAATLLIAPSAQAEQSEPRDLSVTPTAAVQPRIDWGRCSRELRGWRCGKLIVPLDWNDPTNPATASIALAVRPATGPARQRIGALTFNPGGPGGSGLDLAAVVDSSLPAQIRRQFDFVAWDPRGVGRSTPQLRGCVPTSDAVSPQGVVEIAQEYELPPTGPVDWAQVTASMGAELEQANVACLERNPDVAPYLGTGYVIQDLEAMRIALGEQQWNFWGMSYGTRIGYRYARTYPASVRTLILDGSWPPNLTVKQWSGMDTWSWAYGQEVYSSLMGNRMTSKFTRVVKGLNNRTVTIGDEVITRWNALPVLFSSISQQSQYREIARTVTIIYRALRGRDPLPQAQQRAFTRAMERLRAAADDGSSALNLTFINCADMRGRPTADDVTPLAQTAYDNASVFASLLVIQKGLLCSGLPENLGPAFPRLVSPLRLPTPPVIVQATGDTRTPWLGGQTMAGMLTGSAFISYTSTQHVSYLQVPSTCINNPVTSYLVTGQVPASRICPYAPS